jgi:hypothetical protein
MKVEIKNWLGVVVLLCLGFILGRTTVIPGVNAEPQMSGIGRYQLIAGEYEVTSLSVKQGDSTAATESEEKKKTLFRIDTVTGDVDVFDGSMTFFTPDGIAVRYSWLNMTADTLVRFEDLTK